MSEETKVEDKVVCDSIGAAIKHLDEKQGEAAQKFELFRHNFQELTGFQPNHTVNAGDVLKIVYNVWGEPKKND